MSWRRIRRIVRKEFIQLLRDPKMMVPILLTPIIQLFLFGYAVTTDVRHISTAVYDQDRSYQSRQLTERFVRSGYFDFDYYLSSADEIDRLMDENKVQAVISIPVDFSYQLARNQTAPVQIILDGSDSMTAGIISGYVGGVIRAYSGDIALQRLERLRGQVPQVPQVEPRLRVWYNPELTSIYFMVPGVMATILLIITMILTSLAIVKEREIGTLEQLVVTPIKPRELMLGKTIPFVIVGFVDMLLVLVVSVFWFGVPVAGSLGLLFTLTAVFLLVSLGVGLFISTVSRTQQQATMTAFFFMLPSIILSGFMFPIENMPRAIQVITYLIPMRYYLVIVRGIFLKGVGLEVLWPQALAMAALGVAIIALSAWRFSKHMG